MNELQKEYYERQAKEQAERDAAEEARLKAFMEEERKKDAERRFKEEINKAEEEERERLAAEEAERKAEQEAEEIISRMKAKIHEERMRENGAEPVKDESSNEKSGEIPIEVVDEKPEKAETVKEVVKPAADGSKKQTSPKFKKGGKKNRSKNQSGARPKPQETPVADETQVNEATAVETVQTKPSEEKKQTKDAPKAAETEQTKQPEQTAADENLQQNQTVEEAVQENTQAKEDKKVEPEVVNLEGTVETAEVEEAVNENDNTDDTVQKMTPEDKAASDEAAKWKAAAEEAQDRYKRLLAEFENARAREAKEAALKFDLGAKSVLEKLLPVVDNFERAIQTIPEEDKERAFEQGVDKIYKQMMTSLEDMGVQPMNAVGTEFNPDLHNAVMHVEDDALGENVVAEEMQKGYMYKDSVLRYSMVKVAN